MNDDIIRMAREAGWSGLFITYNEPSGKADWEMVKERLTVPVTMEQIERFAALVRADEREACAKVCEDKWVYTASPSEMAEYIRARGQA